MSFWQVLAALILTWTTAGAAGAESASDAPSYANQTTYGNAQTSTIKRAPANYSMLFLETVGRHGARSLTSPAAENRALKVWKAASARDSLTANGRHFARDLADFQRAERTIGYGELSGVGAYEWRGIGRRTADVYAPFFAAAQSANEPIATMTSPVQRTKDSGAAMRKALRATFPDLTFSKPTVSARKLHFTSTRSAKGAAAIAKIDKRSDVRAAAKHVLRRLYTKAYVSSLSDPVGKALDVYLLFSTTPGMADESDVTFARYVPAKDSRVLAYAQDARNFYTYGPGVKGQTGSYKNARPLLDDFLGRLDKRIAGSSTAAVLRFAHGETTMPLAALLKLPGSAKQAAASTPYTYQNSAWRGSVAGKLSGNIEWVAYRNAARRVLVTMRYNEEPVKFRKKCVAATPDGYFYRPAELRRCLT
ncbi:histidine-type phosphatase [soil metagenome]